jgi:multicomponent Na+:H+ antiporter subunit D
VAFFSLAVGLMTIYSMTKIWGQAFWKPHPGGVVPSLSQLKPGERMALILPIAGLALMTVGIGLFPEPFVQVAERAASELLDPAAYVAAVLGEAEQVPADPLPAPALMGASE